MTNQLVWQPVPQRLWAGAMGRSRPAGALYILCRQAAGGPAGWQPAHVAGWRSEAGGAPSLPAPPWECYHPRRLSETPSRFERIAFGVLVLVSLVLRGVAYFRFRFDSDEPQHLHVTWGWTAGLVQYRDLFDNHAPLFHILTAPLLRFFGERPDILLYMRAPMLLLWAVVLGATYVMARRLYSTRVALWATLLLAVFPPFFLKSIEYRNDNLWNALWTVALTILTVRERSGRRMFAAGLVLGLALCASMKTSLLIATLIQAAIVTQLMTVPGRLNLSRLRVVAPMLGGMIIPPLCVAAWFVHAGAWPNLVYCVIDFNRLVAKTHPNVWLPGYLPVLAAILYFCWSRRGMVVDEVTRWRYFLVAAVALFITTLAGFWILISPRDFLPVMPLFAIFVAAAVERTRYATPVLPAIALFFIGLLFHEAENFRDGTREHITMMNQVLGLTRPGEPLMDLKGETIYRRRPFYYIFEYITRAQMRYGFIADTVAESVIAAHCHVVQADGFFPPKARPFLNANFVDVGRLRASGQFIGATGAFTIAIPGDYVVIGPEGEACGTLDGLPYRGARSLAPGEHRFERALPGQSLAVFWAPAYARGYSPFHLRDRDF